MQTNKALNQGIVIAVYPNLVSVLTDEKIISCQRPISKRVARDRKNKRPSAVSLESIENSADLVVGDEVLFSDAMIHKTLPRRSLFSRRGVASHAGGRVDEQKIAANVDQVIAILAAENPAPKWNLLDRYLAAAEIAEIPALICITKMDLMDMHSANWHEMQAELAVYRRLGYTIVQTSTHDHTGLPELKENMQGKNSLLIGKSGVGKSSLINALAPTAERATGAVGKESGKGRHTTSSIWMQVMDRNTTLIDTPGSREFGLWFGVEDCLDWCFREIRPIIGTCRFGLDCRHDEEPGCAVRQAVMQGEISPRRYQSYLHLMDEEGLR
jgi:ribosome biogenesis GTPase